MYYEEKVIDGVLHCRNDPYDVFTPCSAKLLTNNVIRERERTASLEAQLAEAEKALKPFAGFIEIHETMGATAPKSGDIYTVTSSKGTATISVEDLQAARAWLANRSGK